MDWYEHQGNWLLLPPRPQALIHFLGGAFVAAAPQATYRRLLEFLARQGYGIVATPFINTLDHEAIARTTLNQFRRTVESLEAQSRIKPFLPIYGLGHSMGCKLHLLIGSLSKSERAGNILLSFNNYSSSEAIPLVGSLNLGTTVEFTPTPQQTNRLIADRYRVPRNLLIRFQKDDLDQSLPLRKILDQRFPGLTTVLQLPGTHLTPLGQDLNWNWTAGNEFSPLDAFGQWMRQELFRELAQLEREIIDWLDPSISFRRG